jgi:hypothetical protein
MTWLLQTFRNRATLAELMEKEEEEEEKKAR